MNKNVPNILTIARVVLVPVFIVLYKLNLMMAALIVFIVASVTDMLDGKIARKYNIVSNFGKFMDPLADKILTYAAFCLYVEARIIPSWFLIIVLFREFVVAGIRMLAAEKGTVIAADIFGKIKTVLQMVGIPMILLALAIANTLNVIVTGSVIANIFFVAGYVVIALSVVMTLISGANYVLKNKEVFKD